jgi:hypothetical protein
MKKTILLAGLLVVSLFAEMTPERYYELEMKAQDVTLEGKQVQLACAQRECSVSDIYVIDGEYQAKVFEVYKEYGTTPSKIAVYYTHNEKEIKQYLLKNESLQNQMYNNLQTFEMISSDIQNLLEAQ